MWENKGTFLRKMAERWIPERDNLGIQDSYVLHEKVRTKRFFDAIKW